MWSIFDKLKRSRTITDVPLPGGVEKFVIISTPRTGSNLLCGMLNSHPRVTCFHELFHANGIYYGPANNGRFDFGTIDDRDSRPHEFIQKIYGADAASKAIGFKIFQGHNDRVLNFLLDHPEIRKIVLKRDNLLFSYTSALVARSTQKWQQVGDSPSAATGKVHVDPAEFIRYAKKISGFYTAVEDRLETKKFLALEYTDLLAREAVINELLEFIGLGGEPVSKLEKLHRKQNANRLVDRISNYHDLKTALRATPYESFFEE
ncbi:MAG: sulfotransferase [Gammaproteobacteria bacterium]